MDTFIFLNHQKIFKKLLFLNATIFLIKFIGGVLSGSAGVLIHSFDMLGDTLMYGISLYFALKPISWQNNLGLAKGSLLGFFGIASIYELSIKISKDQVPLVEGIGISSLLSLMINIIAISIIFRYRDQSLNLKSSWLACRNDLIANILLIFSALSVSFFNSNIPDLIVGLIISLMFIASAIDIIKQWREENRKSFNSIKSFESQIQAS